MKPGAYKYQLEVQILSADGLRNADWLTSGSGPLLLVHGGMPQGPFGAVSSWQVRGKGKSVVKTKTIKNEHNPLRGAEIGCESSVRHIQVEAH